MIGIYDMVYYSGIANYPEYLEKNKGLLSLR